MAAVGENEPLLDRYQAMMDYLDERIAYRRFPVEDPGSAVHAWAATHLAVVIVWLASAIARADAAAVLIRIVWVLACSGLATRVMFAAVLNREFDFETPRFATTSSNTVLSIWFVGFAIVAMLEGGWLIPELVVVTVLITGSRIAALDAWFKVPRARGDYVRALRSPIALFTIISTIVISVVLQLVGYGFGTAVLGPQEVNENQLLRGAWFVLAFIIAMIPTAVVAELISGVARRDTELLERRAMDELGHVGDAMHNTTDDLVLDAIRRAADERIMSADPELSTGLVELQARLDIIRNEGFAKAGTLSVGTIFSTIEQLAEHHDVTLHLPTGDRTVQLAGKTGLLLNSAILVPAANFVKAGAHTVWVRIEWLPHAIKTTVAGHGGPPYRPESVLALGRGLHRVATQLEQHGGTMAFGDEPAPTVVSSIPAAL